MLIKTRLQLLFAFLVIVFLSTGGLMIGALQDLEIAVTEGSSGRLRLIQSGQIRDQILSASAEVEDLANWNAEDRSRFFGLLESCKETIQQMRLGQRPLPVESYKSPSIDAPRFVNSRNRLAGSKSEIQQIRSQISNLGVFESSQHTACLVGKSFSHPIGVLCTHLDLPAAI